MSRRYVHSPDQITATVIQQRVGANLGGMSPPPGFRSLAYSRWPLIVSMIESDAVMLTIIITNRNSRAGEWTELPGRPGDLGIRGCALPGT
jgi:hypothetical protein